MIPRTVAMSYTPSRQRHFPARCPRSDSWVWEPRTLSYKDAYGRIHEDNFSRYDFIEYDYKRQRYFYDDAYLFSVDLNGGNEYQREALWQRNLENLKAGTLGDPTSPETLLRYWQCQERAHYPYARENVEYFTEVQNETGGASLLR